MNRLFTSRTLLSLALLSLAASALVSGIKTAVEDVTDAAFLPVAVFAVVIAYMLGMGNWSTRRAWSVISIIGLFVILLEVTRIREVIWQTIFQIPSLEVNALIAWIKKEPFETSFFTDQLNEISNRIETFTHGLQPKDGKPSLILRELLWDLPILFLCAWAGWWTSRRTLILSAMGPLLAFLALILNYTEQSALSLQVAVFAFIFLLGIHQNWNIPQNKEEGENKAHKETYVTISILAFGLAIAAGWAPIFSLQETVKKAAELQNVNETLGLEKKVVESYIISSSGLPREHLIDSPPQNLMSVVFTARTGERIFLDGASAEAAVPRHYWRWLTYDLYSGNSWSTSSVNTRSYSADQPLFDFNSPGYQIVHQEIKKSSAEDDRLYWTGSLLRASQPLHSTWRMPPPQTDPLLHMDLLGSLIQAQEYSADSLVPQWSETQLRGASQIYPQEIHENYLDLPTDISPRVRELAMQLTAGQHTAYDKAKAIEAYLRTYPYTLEVPAFPPDKEIADYFLFELKTGYCDYYATSMIVLARAAGLPARLVIGYSSGEYDRLTAQYTIREIHAHSWVEIYFPQIGWVEFEPTTSQPTIERPLTSDSFVSNSTTSAQKNREGILYTKHGYFLKREFARPLVISLVLTILTCLWYLKTQGLLFSYKGINSIYEYIYHHGKKIYRNASPHETPSLFAEKLKTKLMINRRFLLPAAGELDRLTTLYLKETYSPHPVTKDEQEQAVLIWRKLFWRLLYARMILH
jgi:transglutaminase-like putative cysteine protease